MNEMEQEMKENKIKNLNNYQREIESLTGFIAELNKKKELFLRKCAVQEKNYKLILAEFEYLKPSWKYEHNPEYIENVKELNVISMEENRMMWQQQLANMDKGITSSNEQIDSLKMMTDKIEKELSEVEEDKDGNDN